MDLSRHKAELALRAHGDSEQRAKRLAERLAYRLGEGVPYFPKGQKEFREEVDQLLAELSAEVSILHDAAYRLETFPTCDYCGELYDSKMDAIACPCANKAPAGPPGLKIHKGG